MTEILSRDEIDALLMAISTGKVDTTDYSAVKEEKKVKIYDFRRPDKFSKDHIRTLQMMHETFARLITTALSAQLRALVGVHVASVDQLTYEEFIRSTPNPTTLAVINMNPLKGSAVLEIDPSITFTIIDKLFGGLGEATKICRELTDIELSVMEEIITAMLDDLRTSWSNVIDLRPKLENIETNPQFAQIAPPSDMVILVTLETKVGYVEGMTNLCIPYKTISSIIDNLSATYIYESKPSITKNCQLHSREDIPVKLIAEMFRRNFSIKEINDWEMGTVLFPLRPIAPNYCFLNTGDRQVWHCEILPDVKLFPKSVKILNFVESPFETERMENMEKVNPIVTNALQSVKIIITVELGAAAKSLKEVFSMGGGSIIELDKLAGEPLDIKANGVLIAKGEAVVIDENFGVRIVEIIDTPELDTPSSSEELSSIQQLSSDQES